MMSYAPRRPIHALITTCVMVILGLAIAMFEGWLLIVPILVATLSAGSAAGILVAIVAHLFHIMQFGLSASSVSIMIIDIAIIAFIQMTHYRMRMHYVYASLYPIAIICVFLRSMLIVFGTWIQSLFVPQMTETRAPIDVLTLMLTGPALIMTVSAIVGVVIINMILRHFLP